MSRTEVIFEKKPEPQHVLAGASGAVKLLDLQTTGIIPTRMRHVIKRYLKKVGFRALKVEHRMGPNPFSVTLLATGIAPHPMSEEQVSRVDFLRESMAETLNQMKGGYPIHASQADSEFLRKRLALVEPTLGKIYYALERAR